MRFEIADKIDRILEPNGHDDESRHIDGSHGQREVVIIENRPFLGDCMARAFSNSLACRTSRFSIVDEFIKENRASKTAVVVLSCTNRPNDLIQRDLELISATDASLPTIVLGQGDDPDAALGAIRGGAKAYIPTSVRWEIAVEAVRIVIAGGTYLPVEYAVVPRSNALAEHRPIWLVGITERELTVLHSIGKRNKVIARELNISESTVKAHIRRIMSKLQARTRTELAMKSAEMMGVRA